MMNTPVDLSIILPVYNEEGNLRPLYDSLIQVLQPIGRSFEILFCDDGSRDSSTRILRQLTQSDPRVKAIILRRNFGQTPAINAGVDHAQGEIIILMDADQQNDPNDIPKLLEKLDEGYDIVSGWRRHRRDPFLTKVLPSRIANWIISRVTRVPLHDHGCTLKAYRREVLREVSLYGEMHRFISIFGSWTGAKVGEIEVRHHPRKSGKSKYSINRTFKVLLDLPVLILLGSYLTRPIHFFGPLGIASNLIGVFCMLLVAWDKFLDLESKAHRNPLLLLAVFFILIGIQFIMMGLLAELLTRIYHESQQKKTYVVKETVNFFE